MIYIAIYGAAFLGTYMSIWEGITDGMYLRAIIGSLVLLAGWLALLSNAMVRRWR